MSSASEYNQDERIDKIYNLLLKYVTSDFTARETVSEKGDELDGIILGLNTLGEEMQASGKALKRFEDRINVLMEALLKVTLMDFSVKIEISEYGDELDAIAVGLNTLVEELKASKETEQRSIDKLKESEEKFRLIIESVKGYAIFMLDPNGYITTWNKGAEYIKGYSVEEAIGKHISLFYTQEEILRGEAEYNLNEARRNGRYECEAWRKRKDGSVFWADVLITALYDNTGNLRGFSKVTRDITERKITEDKINSLNFDLEQNLAKLEISNKELEAFTYSVSHDLRSPLRAIHSYTKILSEEYMQNIDAEGQSMMVSVMRNAKKMGQLIDDLLAFSKIGKKELQLSMVNITQLVESSLVDLKASLPELKAKICVNPMPPAYADYNLMNLVFTNLMSNAIKYSSSKEKPEVEIGSKEENNQTIYYVKDNGAGFDMKYYNKLFGVFQRLHASEEFEGTGVGLALVKRIVTRHNGRIWAEAKLGEGATFYFTLNDNT